MMSERGTRLGGAEMQRAGAGAVACDGDQKSGAGARRPGPQGQERK